MANHKAGKIVNEIMLTLDKLRTLIQSIATFEYVSEDHFKTVG